MSCEQSRRMAWVRAAAALTGAAIISGFTASAASAQVRFERTGYRLTSIGERVTVSARAQGAVRWRIADSAIASVNAQGIVTARNVGYTRLWAIAGRDSASAIILVDQWATQYDFVPSLVKLDAIGARVPLRVQVRDAAGHPVTDRTRHLASCRSLNDRVATMDASGVVTARANGTTFIRCTDRGAADSVRVEVRQRAASATIVDKLGYTNRVVGDTFRIRLDAKDVAGNDIRDVKATWASLNPRVVSVDPETGVARSVNQGAARVVAQVGDVTDTVSVQVVAGSGSIAPVMLALDTIASLPAFEEARSPSLNLLPLFLTVGDTARVTPRDAAGIAIANAEFRMSSNDSSIVIPLGGQRVSARRTGNTYVVVQFGGLRDSLLVSVRERADLNVVMAGEAGRSAPFVRPRWDVDSARARNRAQLDSASREIRRQSVVAIYSGRMISLAAVVSHTAHSTRDTNFLERANGLLYGGRAEVAPHRRLRLSGGLRTGQLSPTATTGEDLEITEVDADITFQPADWFGLRGGYVRRSTSTRIAAQRWEFPTATALTRFSFVGGAVTTTTAISLLPGAKYTGYLDAQLRPINPNPYSLAGEAGIEAHSGRLVAALSYYVERFTFPRVNNNPTSRTDQFSSLRLRLGVQAGR